jgi:hypothetical protein
MPATVIKWPAISRQEINPAGRKWIAGVEKLMTKDRKEGERWRGGLQTTGKANRWSKTNSKTGFSTRWVTFSFRSAM